MHLGRTTTDQFTRAQCKAQAGKALERAEKIKHHRKDLAPVNVDHFSGRKRIQLTPVELMRQLLCSEAQHSVLVKSSKLNGILIPLQSDATTKCADFQLHVVF